MTSLELPYNASLKAYVYLGILVMSVVRYFCPLAINYDLAMGTLNIPVL